MLDGILGRGYSSKCKSLMKLTKSRMEVIQRKRNATLKFLKKDMADLLARGLEINAYGRAEGLLAELITSSCYEYVDKSCDFVLKHLSVMQKIRHCPDDCKEAVSSLMFAAARFSDLPELRDLRDVFLERYGSSLELFANKEFVEHLSSTPITKEKKLRLMREIASEFNITWDSKGFEQRVSNPSPFLQEKPKVHESSYDNEYRSAKGKDSVPRGNFDVSPKEKHEVMNNERRLHSEKERNGLKRNDISSQPAYKAPNNGYNPPNAREERPLKLNDPRESISRANKEVAPVMRDPLKVETPSKKVGSSSSSQRKRTEPDLGSRLSDDRENTAPKRDGLDPLSHGKPKIHSSLAELLPKGDNKDTVTGNKAVNSVREIQDEAHKSSFYYNNARPPPYTKPSGKQKEVEHSADNATPMANGNGHDNGNNAHQEIGIINQIPKPRSSRRRHSKPRSSRDEVDLLEDSARVPRRRSKSRRRDDSRLGLQILFDNEHYQNDEEERMIDRLLIHYSRKPSACEPGTVRRKPRSHQPHDRITEFDHKAPDQINGDEVSEIVTPPRSVSLPREQTAQPEAVNVFNRAASFQPDRSSAAKHVHPKLPDYDDLAARFAALKGR